MERRLGRMLAVAAVLGGFAIGCSGMSTQKKQPPDPLLLSKKPVEGKPTAYQAQAQTDPLPPAVPNLPPLPAGREYVAPGLQRDPVSRTQLGFQPSR